MKSKQMAAAILLGLWMLLLLTSCTMVKKEQRIMVALREGVPSNQFIWNSAILATEEWNSDTTHRVKALLVPYTYDGSNSQMGIGYTILIKKEKPAAVVGSTFSEDVIQTLPKIHMARIPYLTQGTDNRLTSQNTENLYRLQASDSTNCKIAVKFIAESLKVKKIALIYQEGDFGREAKSDLERAASVQGVQLVSAQSFDPDAKSISPKVVEAINKSSAELCVLWSEKEGHKMLMAAIEKTPLKMRFLANTDFQVIGEEKWNLKAFEGSFVMNQFMYLSSHEYWRDRMQKRFGVRPSSKESPVVYDAVMQVLTALEATGAESKPTLLNATLHEQSYTGVCGTYAYDEKGEGVRQAYIAQIKEGKLKFFKLAGSSP